MPILQTILTSLASGIVLVGATMWVAGTLLKSNHGTATAIFLVFGPAGLLGGIMGAAGYLMRSKALGLTGAIVYGLGVMALGSELVTQWRKPPVLKLAFEVEVPQGEYRWFYSPNEQAVQEFPPYASRVLVAGNMLTGTRELFDVADRRFIWIERQSDGFRERLEIPVAGYPMTVTGWSEWQVSEAGKRFRWRLRHPKEKSERL